MKAILKYSLYKRPQPTNEIGANGYLEMNSAIEVKQILPGKSIDGIGIWFYADDGFFYWGGGADFSNNNLFQPWDGLSVDIKKALLESIVSDKLYWLEKKVVGYVGCGWGYKNDDTTKGLAVTVFVDSKTTQDNIGSKIRYKGLDIPVDVKEVGEFEHLSFRPGVTDIAPDISNPIDMGGSISVAGSKKYGTRSMVLVNDEGVNCLLTCFHVFFDTSKLSGEANISSSTLSAESPCRFRNPFPRHVNVKSDFKIIGGRYNAYYDFAVVAIPSDLRFSNGFGNIRFTGYYLLGELKNLQNEIVTMAGANSNKQFGKVLDIGKSLIVNGTQTFNDLVVTEKISVPGDSGAPVVDRKNKLVGIVIAGNKIDNKTLILPISYLFTQLGYKFPIK